MIMLDKLSLIYDELYQYTETKKVINTHCHHREDEFHTRLSLDVLLSNSYVNWCGVPLRHITEDMILVIFRRNRRKK